ncbi:hypothetical protein HK102_007603 [Quaeritorhiza haematococci]|nr:hypothetical protein HK102_007603 [Quaeritorhiza haematococci]
MRRLRMELRAITRELMKNRSFRDFSRPVNREEYPEYYEIVENPMDLTTMTWRINYGEYQSPAEWVGDLELIVRNTIEFNEEGSMIVDKALHLRDTALSMIESLPADFVWECKQMALRRRASKLAGKGDAAGDGMDPFLKEALEESGGKGKGKAVQNKLGGRQSRRLRGERPSPIPEVVIEVPRTGYQLRGGSSKSKGDGSRQDRNNGETGANLKECEESQPGEDSQLDQEEGGMMDVDGSAVADGEKGEKGEKRELTAMDFADDEVGEVGETGNEDEEEVRDMKEVEMKGGSDDEKDEDGCGVDMEREDEIDAGGVAGSGDDAVEGETDSSSSKPKTDGEDGEDVDGKRESTLLGDDAPSGVDALTAESDQTGSHKGSMHMDELPLANEETQTAVTIGEYKTQQDREDTPVLLLDEDQLTGFLDRVVSSTERFRVADLEAMAVAFAGVVAKMKHEWDRTRVVQELEHVLDRALLLARN